MNKLKIIAACFVLLLSSCTEHELPFDDNPIYDENIPHHQACVKEQICESRNTEFIDHILDLMSVYSPDSREIVRLDYMTCPREYTEGRTKEDQIRKWFKFGNEDWENTNEYNKLLDSLDNMDVYVHEAFHETSDIVYGNETPCGHNYHLDSKKIVFVPFTGTFLNSEIAPIVPNQIKSTLRYGVYVEGNVWDIYSLLNEFGAYYYGTKMSYDLWPLFKGRFKKNSNSRELDTFTSSFRRINDAYYEFKYFIMAYLHVAKRKYPKIHGAIMDNETFWEVFNFIDPKFNQLQNDYRVLLTTEPELTNYNFDNSSNDIYLLEIQKLDWR